MKKRPKLDNVKKIKKMLIFIQLAHIAQLVEHVHGKDGVVSSILAVGTIIEIILHKFIGAARSFYY